MIRWFLVLATVLGVVAPAAPSAAQTFPANQPFASYWFPNELLAWSPGSDPDAPYNRGSVPLATRFTNPSTQVNPNARDGEGGVATLPIMYPSTSSNPSQGSEQFDVHAFSYWQYVDHLVFWGGSAGEGLILAPSADVIDSGHRNGVPVLGTIFLPPVAFGGQIAWVNDLIQKSGSTFPVADKLIEVADYYGFDGWFLNQETAGGDSTTAALMQEFLEYYQANRTAGQEMMWYDSMIHNGNISWQNQLNDANDQFFEDVNGRVSDTMFLNFGWGSGTRLADSNAHALGLGRSPYELFAGIDVQANGYNVNPSWSKLFPDSSAHVTSLGFYGTNWTYTNSASPADYYERANRFWSGQNGDPSNTATGLTWKGVAHYVPARSPVDAVPFVTSFNPGQGNLYAVAGEVLRDEPWNHRSLQDVLPTWRWITHSAGTPLTPEISFDDAYDGGACLKVSGDLAAGVVTDVDLFKAALSVSAGDVLTVAYRAPAAGPSHIKVGLSFETNVAAFTWFDVDPTSDGSWHTQEIPIGAHAGETIAVISLRFDSPGFQPGFERKIGRLGVIAGAADIPGAPANAMLEDTLITPNFKEAALRLQWDASPDPVYHYRVFRRNPDLSRTYLGGTPNTALYIPRIVRAGAETTAVLEIEAVGPEFGVSPPDTTSVVWGAEPPNDTPVAESGGPYCGLTGVPLDLDGSASSDVDGPLAAWDWTFGDGDSASGAQVAHTYLADGDYQVVLTVTDPLGRTDSDTTTAFIRASAPDPNPALAWWPFNEGSGVVGADSTGQGNDAAINGPTWTTGVLGAALDWDGVDDWALVSDFPKSDTTMTVSAWVWADSRPAWASIAKNWAAFPGAFHLGLRDTDGDVEVQLAESDLETVSVREGSGTPLPLGEWHHIVFVADKRKVRLYRNKTEVGAAGYDGTIRTTRPALGIGVKTNGVGTAPSNGSPSYWDGRIDDVRIYDRALCRAEIESLYDNTLATAVLEVGATAPTRFELSPTRPNPFSRSTEIRYSLPSSTRVRIEVFDVTGRRVERIVDEVQAAGLWSAHWRGRDRGGKAVSAGVYFVRMEAGDFRAVRKMVFLQ
ncbi:MAG: hypothetical protein DHS20C21_17890 [Gemmatimonadota bacterium]|nr:MAG: hypothetical protein DHS20C21_17890 [Gemmatimonadota bacterium]